MKIDKIRKDVLPVSPKFFKMLGPSFVLLGMGLGSGELIMWPYMTANYGLGIIWAAVIGITFQFFINMEIERYTLINGESVFVGLARKLKIFSPIWFILSTIIPWMWPGIALSSALVLTNILNFKHPNLLAIFLLVLVGLILSLGKVVYKTQEIFQKILIFIGVPFVLILTIYLAKGLDWQNLASGLVGRGDGFWWIPKGLPLITFLGAFAYSGAGGNLNLAQSFYIREKEYGMGKYGGKITNLLKKSEENYSLEGKTFEINNQNLSKFKLWWKKVNLEHFLVFWLTGAITIIFLSLLSFVTVYHQTSVDGIGFLFQEAQTLVVNTLPVIGVFFLIIVATMLFSTQLSVMDATSRITSENLIIINKDRFKPKNLSKYYFIFLWTQILLGIIILGVGFSEPMGLVTMGAFLNAITMFVYTILILWLNKTTLPKELVPSWWRKAVLTVVILFFAGFSILTLIG